jgi:hypothetical protein
MWRKRRKTLLAVAGVLYLVFGTLAFFGLPGLHEDHHHTLAHNLTHLLVGLILLGLTFRVDAARRQLLCFGLGGVYLLIGLSGLAAGKWAMLTVIPGVIEFHAGDYPVHFATALFFLVLALLRRSDAPSYSSAQIARS